MESARAREKVKVSLGSKPEDKEHFHQDIELLYILEGEVTVSQGDKETKLKSNDILVINSGRSHSFKASEESLYLQLFIQYSMVSDILNTEEILFWCDSTSGTNEAYDELRRLLKKLLQHYLSARHGVANFGHIALCYQILDLLSVHFLVRSGYGPTEEGKQTQEERIAQINSYIRTNYAQPISIRELSEKLYLSNAYLSRFFKKNYGMTFMEYLTSVRLYYAVDELMYSNEPITRIALSAGFASVTAFNKAFKEAYHQTPSEFRKERNARIESGEQEREDRQLDERLERYLKAEGNPESLSQPDKAGSISLCCSNFDKKPVSHSPMRIINIGEAKDLLRAEIQEHVLLLKDLGFEYVRFWGPFSPEMLVDLDRTDGRYNFSRLDFIFDFLVANKLKPHIELGSKPQIINQTIASRVVDESRFSAMPDANAMERLLPVFFQHLARRYGSQELAGWRVEIWFVENEWGNPKAERMYFALFNRVYNLARRYSSRMQIGGCGLRMHQNPSRIQYFLEKWDQQPCKPDFISVLLYGYLLGNDETDYDARQDTDDAFTLHHLQNLRRMMDQAGWQDRDILVSEFNLSVSDRNFINDSVFMGSWQIAHVLQCADLSIDMGYFHGTDRFGEYYDSGALLHGGRGLLSRDGIIKPSGHAARFLHNTYPYILLKDKHCLLSTNGHESWGLVYHNQKKLNYNYYLTDEDAIDKTSLWKYFEDRDLLKLEIVLEDMSPGTYKIKNYAIDESFGSLLDLWGGMDFEEELSRNDVEWLKKACQPELTMRQKKVLEDGRLVLKLEIKPNQFGFVRIRKLV